MPIPMRFAQPCPTTVAAAQSHLVGIVGTLERWFDGDAPSRSDFAARCATSFVPPSRHCRAILAGCPCHAFEFFLHPAREDRAACRPQGIV